MKPHDDYTDIFDERPAPSFEQRLTQLAALLKNAHEPPAQLSWAHLQWHMRKKDLVLSSRQRMAFRGMSPRPHASRRLALIAGLLCLLLFSGFTYATLNLGLLGTLFSAEPASQYLLQAQQFTPLQQSQALDGYQVQLDKAYADANRILIGVVVTYPSGINQKTWNTSFVTGDPTQILLHTHTGQDLSFLADEVALNVSNPHAGKEGILMAFDAAAIEGNPAQLPLHLAFGVECSVTNDTCHHTLTYDFTLPFHPGRVLNLHQTVIANGHPLTLEKVVITPSETRLSIHWQKGDLQPPAFAIPGGPTGPTTYAQTMYGLQLTTGGQTYPICQVGGGSACRAGLGPISYPDPSLSFIDKGGSGLVEQDLMSPGAPQIVSFSLYRPLFQQHGTWALTITRFTMPMQKNDQGGYGSMDAPSRDDSAQPWVFHFDTP